MDNQAISFKARFGGVAREIYVPVTAVAAIYASENGQGMAFDVIAELAASEEIGDSKQGEKSTMSLATTNEDPGKTGDDPDPKENRKKPSLTIIK